MPSIDRPLRPSFVDGLRNEVQIVVTVLSIAPGEFYDALAINAASLSTQISGLPFSGPIAGVRLALLPGHGEHADQGRVPDRHPARGRRLRPDRRGPRARRRRRRHHDGGGRGDRGQLEPHQGRRHQAERAGRGRGPRGRQAVPASAGRRAEPGRPHGGQGDPDVPRLPGVQPETYDFVAGRAYDRLVPVYQIADKQERQNADDEVKSSVKEQLLAAESGSFPPSRRSSSTPRTSR